MDWERLRNYITMELEKANNGDVQALFNLINEAYDLETGSEGIAFKNCGRFLHISEAEKLIDKTWVIRDRGQIIACISIVARNDVAYVGPMAVHSSYRGKKLASKMLALAETMASVVEVEVVSCRSDLFPMYEKLGFKETHRFPAEDYIEKERLTRNGLQMVSLQKKSSSTLMA